MAYPVHAAQFQTQFEVGLETVYGTVATTTKVLQTTDEPEVNVSTEGNETPIVSGGTAEPQAETFVQGRSPNSIKWSARMNNYYLKLCLSSLCQDAAYITGTNNVDPFVPFAAYPNPMIGFSFRKVFGPSASPNALKILGAICRSMKLSSQSGQGLMIESEWQGISGAAESSYTPSATAFQRQAAYAHSAFATGFAVNSVQMKPTKFDLTVSAPGGAYYGTSQAPEEVGLGPWSIKGSFSVSAREKGLSNIATMAAGTWQPFLMGLGATTTAWSLAADILLLSQANSVEDGFEVMTYNFALAKSTTAVTWSVGSAALFTP